MSDSVEHEVGRHRTADSTRGPSLRTPGTRYRRCTPLFGSSTPEPLSPHEARFARELAHDLNYAAAVVATEPDTSCHPADSPAALVKRLLERKDPREREQARARALELLGAPPAERRALFGDRAIDRMRGRAAQPIMSRARHTLLRDIARQRVETFRNELHATYDYAASGALPAFPVCPSHLEGVLSTQANEYYTQLTISAPTTLDFRWSTECDDAEIGVWEVRSLPSGTVLASGTVGRNVSFSVDFASFLPPQAPSTPELFDVRIRPHFASKFEKVPGATPGSTKTVKTPPKPAGSYSNPVLIAYALDESEPIPFLSTTFYRRLTLHIDDFELVEKQSGGGDDEYWLHAALVEREGDEPPQRKHLLARKFTFGNKGTKAIDYSRSITLEYPSSARWPKEQVLVMTVMEEDGGEDIAVAMSEVWDWLAGWLTNQAFEEISDFLAEIGLNPLAAGGISAGLIATALALAGSVVGAIASAVLSALAGIILIIEGATADDFLGTKIVQFRLPTNDDDFVQQAIPGSKQPDGSYSCDPHFVEFKEWTMPAINAYDAFVKVEVHWELTAPEELPM